MKYYCRSGGFRVVHDATGPVAAARLAVKKALAAMRDGGSGLGLLMTVSERGHDDPDAVVTPVIPLAKQLGSVIPVPVSELAERYGLDVDSLDTAARKWLFG